MPSAVIVRHVYLAWISHDAPDEARRLTQDGAAARSPTLASGARLTSSLFMQAAIEERAMQETVITRAGLERLTAELERLKTDERLEIAARLKDAAASEANRAENVDYLAVLEDQALLERRIARLEDRLPFARVVEPERDNGRVDVGERVRLRDLQSGERLEIELVGPLESDPIAGHISVASPLGRAVVGLRRGHIAEVDAPAGRFRFKVLAVEAPPTRAA
jgi:transcription elongation factor GreA